MKNNKLLLSIAALGFHFLMSQYTLAEELFSITISAQGQTVTESFSDAENLIDSFDTDLLVFLFPGFDKDNDPVTASLDFRGVDIDLAYTGVGRTDLELSIPSAGINKTFTGRTRDESEKLLKRFLKGDGKSLLDQLFQGLASTTPTDPIAGNPESLMSTMVQSIFDIGIADNTLYSDGVERPGAQYGFGLKYSRYTLDNKDTTSISLPLAYSFALSSETTHSIRVSLPLEYVEVSDSKYYKATLGLAYSWPVTERWTLTPSYSYGAIASEDFGGTAAVQGIALTGRFTWTFDDGTKLIMGNAVGKYTTHQLDYSRYSLAGDIENRVYTNGLRYTRKLGSSLVTTFFLTDTIFTGDDLFVEHTDELGVEFNFKGSGSRFIDKYATMGISYLLTDVTGMNGFRLKVRSSF